MTPRFYMTPGSCSTGIHLLLEEVGMVFEAHVLNLPAGDTQRPEFLALNPKGTIPVLVCADGAVLTDFVAIAWWLALRYPRLGLLPSDRRGEVSALELMNLATGFIHGQGFARIFTPDRFGADAAGQTVVEAEGRAIVARGFDALAARLPDEGFALGAFGVADAALFYVEFWADRIGLALPPRCEAHYRRMLARPAVRQVLAEEGYRSTLAKAY